MTKKILITRLKMAEEELQGLEGKFFHPDKTTLDFEEESSGELYTAWCAISQGADLQEACADLLEAVQGLLDSFKTKENINAKDQED